MSWANRHVIPKRNISQIPEELRPHIVPRIAKPEVVLSESFQEVTRNEIIINNRKQEKINTDILSPIPSSVNSSHNNNYIIKSIAIPSIDSYELKYKDQSIVFVILRHIRNIRDNNLWISSYNSVRNYYTNKIIIIDDNSTINTVNGKLTNTEIIKSEFNGAGELLPYYYFLKYKWADKMIFLHDSMGINRRFKDTELEADAKFHWYFNSNEKQTNNNEQSKLYLYISMLKNNENLSTFITNNNSIWKGCFGAASIIDYKIVSYLEDKYTLFTTLPVMIRIRTDRETFERLFGLLLFFENIVNDTNCSNYGNIVGYPNAFESTNLNFETTSTVLKQRSYDAAIIKVWRGR